jgi:hypothetical protein
MGALARLRAVTSLGIIAAVAVACGGGPTAPTESGLQLTQTLATAHFDFRWSAGDAVDAAWQEAFHEWATRELQVTAVRRIQYNKYLSPSHMLALHYGPGDVNAWADPDLYTVHTIWPTDNHETIHLYAATFGRMPPLFNEGLAVAFQMDPIRGDMTPRWNNRQVHDVTKSLRALGTLVPLVRLLTIDGWRGVNSQVAYPAAGSFVRFLLDTRGGIVPLKALFALSTQTDAPDLVRRNFEEIYRRSLDAVEIEWIAFLDARP